MLKHFNNIGFDITFEENKDILDKIVWYRRVWHYMTNS